jgi:pyruvate/2-oxoglutarate dehydrogenase complex dihydrolipoamide acyltransferase (E2) component
MSVDIVFPEFAEDGDEKAKVLKWLVEEGQIVEEDDEIVELLTDKATFTVPAPATGKVTKKVKENEEISVNTVLGTVTPQ